MTIKDWYNLKPGDKIISKRSKLKRVRTVIGKSKVSPAWIHVTPLRSGNAYSIMDSGQARFYDIHH